MYGSVPCQLCCASLFILCLASDPTTVQFLHVIVTWHYHQPVAGASIKESQKSDKMSLFRGTDREVEGNRKEGRPKLHIRQSQHLCSSHIPQFVLVFVKKGGNNRPLALRGHVTNASFKQWVGILLMPKIDRAHKNYLTPEIWEETHLREIFYGTLIFQQSSMICIGCHVGGHTLALQHGGQNYFLLVSC